MRIPKATIHMYVSVLYNIEKNFGGISVSGRRGPIIRPYKKMYTEHNKNTRNTYTRVSNDGF